MGLFGNPNKKVEKTIKKLEKQGFSNQAYKTRNCCEKCKYFAADYCRYHNRTTYKAELCRNYRVK